MAENLASFHQFCPHIQITEREIGKLERTYINQRVTLHIWGEGWQCIPDQSQTSCMQ